VNLAPVLTEDAEATRTDDRQDLERRLFLGAGEPLHHEVGLDAGQSLVPGRVEERQIHEMERVGEPVEGRRRVRRDVPEPVLHALELPDIGRELRGGIDLDRDVDVVLFGKDLGDTADRDIRRVALAAVQRRDDRPVP
jgi:hypothetical protein